MKIKLTYNEVDSLRFCLDTEINKRKYLLAGLSHESKDFNGLQDYLLILESINKKIELRLLKQKNKL